uniref:Uncharacterized protein n=1 Tax=Acrobeloides nanus TaxID=290746 RepID=A0A914C7P7_9BILA
MTCDNNGDWTITGKKITVIKCNVQCLSCTSSQVLLESGEVTPSLVQIGNTTSGCLQENAVCNGTKQGIAIQFNNDPSITFSNTSSNSISQQLVCDNNGIWSVNGHEVANASCIVLCETCINSQILLQPGDVTPTLQNLSRNSNNCTTENAVCFGSHNGIAIQFNNDPSLTFINTSSNSISQQLVCDNNGIWSVNGHEVANASCIVLCETCINSQILLQPDDVTPTLQNLGRNSNNCTTEDAVCNGSHNGIAIQQYQQQLDQSAVGL